jgi:multidrug efflux pump
MFEFCIRRSVFSTVLSLVLVLLGVVSYTRLTVREYPNVDEPVVSVSTTYPGASASIIESQITQVLEGSIAGIAGIDVLESTSRAETSRITVRFLSNVDQDVAASDVRDRVSRVRKRLPEEVQEPTIAKVEADAQAILNLVFTSDQMNALEITDYVDRFVLDRLKNLTGVADVTIYGERRYAMRIWIDRERLAAFNLTVQDVENALKAQNVELPAGRIESRDREFSVLSRTGLATPEQFRNVIVKIADAHGAGRRRRAPRQPLQRPARHHGRHHQAGGGEPARCLQGGARRHAGDQPVAAAGAFGDHRQRQLRVHRPLDRGGLPHHRRGHCAGGARDRVLPALAARLAGADRHHPDLAHRHLHAALCSRVHRQYLDLARHGARHRPGGR